jgi:hypothetical protein
VRVYTDIAYHEEWAIVAHYEPSLSLANFLGAPHRDEVDISQFEEMRERTERAGFVQRRPQSWAWLVSLPRGIVRFRRLEFVVFDDWTRFCQQQPADQLGNSVEIPTEVDDGFEIRWIWGRQARIRAGYFLARIRQG